MTGMYPADLPVGVEALVDPTDRTSHLWRMSSDLRQALCDNQRITRRDRLDTPPADAPEHQACLLALGVLLAERMSALDIAEHQRGF
ncbi:MAG TPA: hypothetical protein VFQ42_03930 [Mycobacterium sp.]|nr:hypothetical protein [Mycobacterium sp.]